MLKASLMLADHAQAVGGKLYICGGGWSVTGPEPSPSAIAVEVKVPWLDMNRDHAFRIELVDGDGQPFEVETPEDGMQPLTIDGTFQVTPAPGIKPGSELAALVAINLPPQMLTPGQQYEWRLSINGKTNENWRAAFSVRSTPMQQAA
jgi:hypothetical protein